ncbi:hypothetical protein BYT27DRAFT_6483214 [Phlegmacium glaucopus]|nr:hypothetical protein BYT27DRAFT_6483214 [Phlegmacium glaucopus]
MSSSTSYPARSEEMVQPNSIAYVSMASEVTQLRLRCSRLEEERDKYRNFLRNWIELARTWDKLESESAEQQVMITGTTPSLSPPALAAEIQRVKSEEKMQENPHDSRCPPK